MTPRTHGSILPTALLVCCTLLWFGLVGAAPTHAATSDTSAYPIQYDLEDPGEVSLAVYDPESGQQVRTLARADDQSTGPRTVEWDGLDRHGESVACGVYEWRSLQKPPFEAEFMVNLGIKNFEPGGGFDVTGTRQVWVGNHDGPYGVYVDRSRRMYVSSPNSENTPHIISRSLDGKTREWQNFDQDSRHRHGGLEIIGRDRDVFILNSGGYVQTARKENGAFWKHNDGSQLLFRVVSDTRAGRFIDFEALDIAEDPHDYLRFVIGDSVTDELRWYDPDSKTKVDMVGTLTVWGGPVYTRSVPSPRSVAAIPGEGLLVVSEGRVLSLSDRNGDFKTVISDSDLTKPTRVAYAPYRDEILVVEGSPRPNRVSRFDREGNRLRTYGKEGGRDFGAWNPESFYRITGITANREGGFIVTEAGPRAVRRTVHFDRYGEIREDLFGGMPWGTVGELHPEDPSLAVIPIGKPVWGLIDIDYENKSWELLETYGPPEVDGLFSELLGSGENSPTGMPRHVMSLDGTKWKMERRNGNLYMLYTGSGGSHGKPAILEIDRENGKLNPVAAAGWIADSIRYNDSKNPPQFWAEAMERKGIDWENDADAFRSHQGYTWSDGNENGEVDPEELSFTEKPSISFYTDVHFDDNWNVYFAPDPQKTTKALHRLPSGQSEVPSWNWDNVEELDGHYPEETSRMGNNQRVEATHVSGNGGYYQSMSGHRHPREDWQGSDWPHNNMGSARLMKYGSDGSLLWNVGRAGSNTRLAPGSFTQPLGILGVLDDVVVAHDRMGRPAQVWTQDGLYAGDFLQTHVKDDYDPSIYSPGIHSSGSHHKGLMYRDQLAGKMWNTSRGILWQPPGRTSTPVYRINGWSGWRRDRGRVSVDTQPREASDSGVGLRGEYFEKPDLLGTSSVRTDSRVRFGSRRRKSSRDPKPFSWFPDRLPINVSDGFSVRWTGYVEAPFTDTYELQVETVPGDKVRVWIDDKKVIDAWSEFHGNWLSGDTIELRAGEEYPIRVEYSNDDGDSSMHLSWESHISQERRTIPRRHLFSDSDSLVPEPSRVCPVPTSQSSGSGSGGGGGCLIQRTVPGDWTETIRELRDGILLPGQIGRVFTKGYYQLSDLLLG